MTEQQHTLDERLAACTEQSKVAIVFGGIDCDGVRYDNHVSMIDASVEQYQQRISCEQQSAEGPLWYRIEKPSIALKLQSTERDLVLEAFENGHPHTLRI